MPNALKLLLADVLLVLQVAFRAVVAKNSEYSVPVLPALFKSTLIFVLSGDVFLFILAVI